MKKLFFRAIAIPLVLGSIYSLCVFLIYPFIIVRRIENEEKLLENELDGYMESSVVLDENKAFAGVNGERRVKNVQILNRNTGEYEPVDNEKHIRLHRIRICWQNAGTDILCLKIQRVVWKQEFLT